MTAQQPVQLTEEQEAQKRHMYDAMKPRRRKFVDKIGYDNWNPFAPPKDPIEIRTDVTSHTSQELATKFLRSRKAHTTYSQQYAQGVMEAAVGLLNDYDKQVGAYEFAIWYHQFKKQQGIDDA